MDPNMSNSFSAIKNGSERNCCANLLSENIKLRRALRSEREKRRVVTAAFNEMVAFGQTFQTLKETVDSLSSSDDEEGKENILSGSQAPDKEQRTPTSHNDRSVVHTSHSEGYKTPLRLRKSNILRETFKARDGGNAQPRRESTSSNRVSVSGTPNWYFVDFEDDDEKRQRNERKLDELLCRTEERCEAIAETSKRRATIAANRRAVAMDLLKGKRQLDDETLHILHSDSSKISSFPAQFMKERRDAARRSFNKTDYRIQRERVQQKQLEMATNRILAHSSSAISKTIAQVRSSFSAMDLAGSCSLSNRST